MIVLLALIVYEFPSVPVTLMVVGSTNCPDPFKYVTLFFLKRPSIPFVREVTIDYLFF